VIETELQLCDLATVEKRVATLSKRPPTVGSAAATELATMQRSLKALNDGHALWQERWTKEEANFLQLMQLLTFKVFHSSYHRSI
jgi:ribosome-binding ATPase YchF (GTP1/OBG family)